jgi:phosphate transport system permease protein
MLSAGIAVGVLITPLVASVSEDAMRAVPVSLREASFGLGANRATTTIRVVVPAAVSGIAASLILAFSRAIGETMIVFMAAGAVGGALFTINPLDPGQTMTAAIASLATGTDQVAGEGLAFQSLFFVGLLLFIMTLVLNWASNRIVRRFREVY